MLRDFQLISAHLQSSLRGALFAPTTHTSLDSRHGASRVRREISGLPGHVFLCCDSHSPSNRLDRAHYRCANRRAATLER